MLGLMWDGGNGLQISAEGSMLGFALSIFGGRSFGQFFRYRLIEIVSVTAGEQSGGKLVLGSSQ